MKKFARSGFLAFLLVWAVVGILPGQRRAVAPPRDTAQTDQVKIEDSRTLEIFQTSTGMVRKLVGAVKLRQDSILLTCDSAIISDLDTRVQAMGNVVIRQGDSIRVFSDSVIYSGFTRIADLYGEVVLENGTQQLFTDSLKYNLATKLATYKSGAVLVNGETKVSSRRGYFYVATNDVYFRDSVRVADPQFNLKSDTLKFNTQTRVATFLGPTLIGDDSTRIYTEAGFYDLQNKLAEFSKNAQYERNAQLATAKIIRYNGTSEEYQLLGDASFEEGARKATADTIRYEQRTDKTFLKGNAHYVDEKRDIEAPQIEYDARNEVYSTRGRARISEPPQILEADTVDYREELGFGLALGNVLWRDTSANLTIRCEKADYNRKTDYLKAQGGPYGRPLLITLIDQDSLYLASDTLISTRRDTVETDSSRLLLAFPDVRIFKSDLQAICDSLAYDSRDSIFYFFKEPMVWSDTSQFSADTVRMRMKNDEIERIFLDTKALIINSSDEIFFNQIQGKNIVAFLREGQLQRMEVAGNAKSIYYALDDGGAYIGVNETVCSDMIIYWGNNEVERIRFLNQPEGKANPMGKVDHSTLRLDGFRWVTDVRPQSIWDLFDQTKGKTPSGERLSFGKE